MNPIAAQKKGRRGSYQVESFGPVYTLFSHWFEVQTRLLQKERSLTADLVVNLLTADKALMHEYDSHQTLLFDQNLSLRHRVAMTVKVLVELHADVNRALTGTIRNPLERVRILSDLMNASEQLALVSDRAGEEFKVDSGALVAPALAQRVTAVRLAIDALRFSGSARSFAEVRKASIAECDKFLGYHDQAVIESELVVACRALSVALDTRQTNIDQHATFKLAAILKALVKPLSVFSQALMLNQVGGGASSNANVKTALRSLAEHARSLVNAAREATTEHADERTQLAQAIDSMDRQINLLSDAPAQINAAGATAVFSVGKRSTRCPRVLAA